MVPVFYPGPHRFRGRSRIIINQKCSYVTLSSNGDLDRQFDGSGMVVCWFVLDHEAKRKILIRYNELVEAS